MLRAAHVRAEAGCTQVPLFPAGGQQAEQQLQQGRVRKSPSPDRGATGGTASTTSTTTTTTATAATATTSTTSMAATTSTTTTTSYQHQQLLQHHQQQQARPVHMILFYILPLGMGKGELCTCHVECACVCVCSSVMFSHENMGECQSSTAAYTLSRIESNGAQVELCCS